MDWNDEIEFLLAKLRENESIYDLDELLRYKEFTARYVEDNLPASLNDKWEKIRSLIHCNILKGFKEGSITGDLARVLQQNLKSRHNYTEKKDITRFSLSQLMVEWLKHSNFKMEKSQ